MLNATNDNSLSNYTAAAVITLMALGTVSVFSASANLSQELDLGKFYSSPALRRILFFPIAVAVMYILSGFDYRRLKVTDSWWETPATYLLIISIALLIIVLIPRFGTEINRARRWIRIPLGPTEISFQPSELAKWSLVFFLACFCHKFSKTMALYRKRFIPVCLLIATVAGLIILEDFGTAVFISVLALMILLFGGAKFWHILTPLPFAAAGFCAAVMHSPTRMERLAAFLHPQKWADSTAYQANQSLIALGSGGLIGKGLGKGICKYGHLPEDTTDFIFAIIGEELGFVGTAVVIILFIIFLWLGILIVVRCRDKFGQLLAGGIVLTIAAQAAVNIGVVTVVLPTKGIPLPFISAGGTSMLLGAAAVGVLMNIAKQSPQSSQQEQQR